MTSETFGQAITFAQRTDQCLFISGGEPAEHPHLIEFVDRAVCAGITVFLLSNGMFFEDNPRLWEELKYRGIYIQVTNDNRYYPKRVKVPESPFICVETRIRSLVPLGKAQHAVSRYSPMCFNLRSATRTLNSFIRAVRLLRLNNKMCTPSINVDGTLAAGESPECYEIGTIWDDDLTLTNSLIEMTCRRCGLIDSLSDEFKRAVGES